MAPWTKTTTERYGVVKWNFVAKGQKQLSLEVGDTVHIQEVCDGWYRGYLSRNKAQQSVCLHGFYSCIPQTPETESGLHLTVISSQLLGDKGVWHHSLASADRRTLAGVPENQLQMRGINSLAVL
ncbi:dedicator of cytokinesis protein 2 [Lates japonicus]|uniref:Dedicator of cytokinesis protein 2 n=1 Tax=Lates japonicus TaxID=270547 RepID=A0AAD3RFS1_LATJO|nr:dedicator of cytokinesis protein 2 [Lates japonicus]